ncbi:MAG: hypothetical protein ACMUEL_00300 [Flavobacteriales bacterium Tduv]
MRECGCIVNQYIVSSIWSRKQKNWLYTQKIAQISFSELYMERFTRRSETFKRLNILIHWEVYVE